MMKKEILFVVSLLLLASCRIDDAEYLQRDELGTTAKVFTVSADIGRLKVPVYANKPGQVRVLEGAQWLSAVTERFDSDASVYLDYLYNEGFPRQGLVELRTDTRCDSIVVRQEGIAEILDIKSSAVVVYNGQEPVSLPVEGNVDLSAVKYRLLYIDGEDWISSVALEAGKITISTVDNPDPVNSRRARIRLTYTDGWHQERNFSVIVTQAPSGNVIGQDLSFPQVRELGSVGGALIVDDYCIEGYVVSRPESGNVGENAVLAMNFIDYAADKETAYVESLDGKFGFRIRTASADDNVFVPDTYVRLLLNGAMVQKELDPERYTVSGVTEIMVLESKAAGAIPEKRMRMSELTDDDVYTYVTLLDCEIPVRKGCLTPVNEGYTALFSSDRVSKYPRLIRDIEGSSMYMYTNTTCPYRRTGRVLPYGKGTISGVIVHENYRSFVDHDNEDEDLCGNIGRYQIRHMRYEDLALEQDIENSFSALLTEYRYMNIPEHNPDNAWLPTYGNNGYFTHSYTKYVNPDCKTHGWPTTDYSYLGPCGSGYKNNINGFGVILEDGTDYGRDAKGNVDGKGRSESDARMCWGNSNWWYGGKGESWIVVFSTEGIESDVVSMQLSTLNVAQSLRTPRYWKAEWSLDMASWNLIGEYVVPDVGINSNTLVSQSLGFKQMDFPLPQEILGNARVYVRLIPLKDAASSGNDYDTSTINNKGGNAINYFAIRYNK